MLTEPLTPLLFPLKGFSALWLDLLFSVPTSIDVLSDINFLSSSLAFKI